MQNQNPIDGAFNPPPLFHKLSVQAINRETPAIRHRIFILSTCYLVLHTLLAAAGTRLQEEQARLDSLRQALDEFRQQEHVLKAEESRNLEHLDHLQRQLGLSAQLVGELKQHVSELDRGLDAGRLFLRRNQKRLDSLQQRILVNEQRALELREHYRESILHLYKGRREDPMYWLLASGSLGQAWERARWFPWFSRGVKNTANRLREQQATLEKLEQQRHGAQRERQRRQQQQQLDRRQAEQTRQETSQRLKQLDADRRHTDEELDRVKHDKALVAERNVQAQRAQEQIGTAVQKLQDRWDKRQNRLDVEASERKTLEKMLGAGQKQVSTPTSPLKSSPMEIPSSTAATTSDLRKLKGKLQRPVKGKLGKSWGPHRDPATGTVTNNPGNDYRCEPGAPVRLVHPGRVVNITWLQSHGNTILVDHGFGVISVYSKLETVNDLPDTVLPAGTILGHAGSMESSGQGDMHFELWLGRESQNPESWLK